jgi:RNA polymerase subunit RPABC4/transcription elongation factor Spt4
VGEEDVACPACGVELLLYCTTCGAEVSANAEICPGCGETFEE